MQSQLPRETDILCMYSSAHKRSFSCVQVAGACFASLLFADATQAQSVTPASPEPSASLLQDVQPRIVAGTGEGGGIARVLTTEGARGCGRSVERRTETRVPDSGSSQTSISTPSSTIRVASSWSWNAPVNSVEFRAALNDRLQHVVIAGLKARVRTSRIGVPSVTQPGHALWKSALLNSSGNSHHLTAGRRIA
jgi:hypothetical protein